MKNILIAVDVDDNAAIIINKTVALLSMQNCKIWFIHVAAPDPDFVGYEPGPQYIRDDRAHVLREEHRSIAASVNKLKSLGFDAEGLLIQGPTIETLLEESKKLAIDLIVMGRHQHGWLYKLFNGPTTTGVIERSKTPILTIPL